MEKQQKQHNHHDHKLLLILYFLGLSVFIGAFFIENETWKMILNIVTIALSGSHVIYEGFKDTVVTSIEKKGFYPNVHVLMTIAAFGAIFIHEYYEGAMLILIFAGAHYIEDYAEDKSKREISKLMNLNVPLARLILNDGTFKMVKVEELQIGDKVLCLTGEQIPTDGILSDEEATIDEHMITGESMPKEKIKNDKVYGGTINLSKDFVMEVTHLAHDTVLAKIIHLVSQTQTNISRTAKVIKKIEPIYVNIVLILAPIFYLAGVYLFDWGHDESIYRMMVFLIVTSPCALAATDIPASLSAISNLAKNGILFKGSNYVSLVNDVRVVAFDKTGTITKGKPVVMDIVYANSINENNKSFYNSLIYSLEVKSTHPIAIALVEYFKNEKFMNLDVEQMIGYGLSTKVNEKLYHIGKPKNIKDDNFNNQVEVFQKEGKTVVVLYEDDNPIILMTLMDIEKDNIKETIDFLRKENITTVLISGDQTYTADYIAHRVGIDKVYANVLPDQKQQIIEELKQEYGYTMMLGDGINDAPALVSADVGISMGDGTDIAIDVSDGVFMKNDISKLKYTKQVSKKLRRIVIENMIFAMGVVLFLVIMNVFGLMRMPIAVVFHEGSTVLVILNGLRMLKRL